MVCNTHLVAIGYWKERDKYMINEIPDDVIKYEYSFSRKSIGTNHLLIDLDAEELGRELFKIVLELAAKALDKPKPALKVLEGQCIWNEYERKFEADVFVSPKW